MIVPMKKLYLVVQDKDILAAMNALRAAGSVHVEHVQAPESQMVTEFQSEAQQLERVIQILSRGKDRPRQIKLDDWKAKRDEILRACAEIHQLKEEMARRQLLMSQWGNWGDFDPRQIEQLRAQGITLALVEVPEKQVAELAEQWILQTVFVESGIARCVIVTDQGETLPVAALALPPDSLSGLQGRQAADQARIAELEAMFEREARYIECFENILSGVREDLAFSEVYAGRGTEEKLSYIKGFCPAEAAVEIERLAAQETWGLMIAEPDEDDRVPTLLRNPRWVRMIQSVFDFADILPGYRELDASAVFLIFFAVFSGMLVGDAGYGLIFFFLTLGLHIALGKKGADKKPFFLGYTLSAAAVVWGVWTGTFFGQGWLPSETLRPMIPWLTDNQNLQFFCFLMGAVHLSIAHVWRAVVRAPHLSFLSEVGWMVFIWGMFFVANMLVLGQALPGFTVWLLGAGAFLILFFTQPSKNPLVSLKAVGFNIVFDFINAFTDIISYIRLFAVGMATVAVADAANAMVAGAVNVGSLFWVIFLHGLNLILAVLAIMVHAFRLNILEFTRHLNMEWSGAHYQPFRRTRRF